MRFCTYTDTHIDRQTDKQTVRHTYKLRHLVQASPGKSKQVYKSRQVQVGGDEQTPKDAPYEAKTLKAPLGQPADDERTPRGAPYDVKTTGSPLGHPAGDGQSWVAGAIVYSISKNPLSASVAWGTKSIFLKQNYDLLSKSMCFSVNRRQSLLLKEVSTLF